MLENKETVHVVMTLDAKAVDKHKKALETLDAFRSTKNEDTLKIHYRFDILYYNVVASLKAVQELCRDPNVVNQVNCDALEKRRILIYQVLEELEKLIKKK